MDGNDGQSALGVTAAGAPAAGARAGAALDETVAATAAFADAFVRWSGRKAVEAGANVTRLRLLYSVHCHGPQKMADLADTLEVTPRNVTALVDALESEGLVRRVPHSTDRRVTLVELTCDSGRIEAQFAAYQASLAALFAGLDEVDRATLVRLMATLHDRIHADATCVAARSELVDA